ncbi:MAG TPA: amidase [Rhizobiaceae bacterium]|nr:amidase [Rhizobiaceae bacterium]
MREPHLLSIAEAGKALRAGEISSVELTQAALARIDALDPVLRSFILVTRERALDEARAAEKELAAGRDRGPLHGIPYGLKDIYDVAGLATTGHSRVCLDNIASEDSAVQARLREGGAVLLGKQATHEFALGGPSPELPFPIARNPWNPEHFTGGSSSGSAAAVAGGIVRMSMGSDTGGSIRLPASYCSIVGLKPTTGLISRRGVYPLAYSLDHCGPLSASVLDTALTVNVIAGFDPLDPASVERPREDFSSGIGKSIRGLRIGYARDVITNIEGHSPELVAAIDQAAETFRSLGASVDDVKLPPLELFGAVALIVMTSEAFTIHETNLRTRPQDYGKIFYQRVVPGAGITASDLTQAFRLRRELALTLERDVFSRFDAVLTSSGIIPAPRIADFSADWPPPSLPAAAPTFVASATGHPALSVPAGFTPSGLPLGLQLIGRYFDEATLFQLGHAFEAAAGVSSVRPGEVRS